MRIRSKVSMLRTRVRTKLEPSTPYNNLKGYKGYLIGVGNRIIGTYRVQVNRNRAYMIRALSETNGRGVLASKFGERIIFRPKLQVTRIRLRGTGAKRGQSS